MEFTMKLSPQDSTGEGQYTKGFLEYEMANLPGVQRELTKVAKAIAVRASENLAEHQYEGHSYIELEIGKIDRFVSLNDERGQAAANAIEGGTWDENGKQRTKGVHALADAAKLPRKKGRHRKA